MPHFDCPKAECPGFEIEYDPSDITFETIQTVTSAIEEHRNAHAEADRPEVTHIRKQINPRRVKGDGFYKVKLGAAENGSQTLCGDKATTEDMSWGDTRYTKNLAFVSCERCKELRAA